MQIDALQNTNCRAEISVYFYTKTADWRSPICKLEGVNLHFGGCQFTFWRPKLSWGCFIEKAHKHLAHKQFLGHPGHRSSRPGTRTKMFMLLGFCTKHINFWPLATGRETPGHPVGRPAPHPGSHRKNLFMFMCLFLSWKRRLPKLAPLSFTGISLESLWFSALALRPPWAFEKKFRVSPICIEQMDAEGLGRKLLLTPSGGPCRTPDKQTVGTVTAFQTMFALQALSSSLNAGTAKGGCLGRGEVFVTTRSSAETPPTLSNNVMAKVSDMVWPWTCRRVLPCILPFHEGKFFHHWFAMSKVQKQQHA